MILTRTVTVNAAFLQEIKEDNRDLRSRFEETDVLLQPTQAFELSPKTVVDALGELRDQLAIHFSLEESFGYFEDAIEVEPRLSAQAHALKSEHVGLFRQICRLVDEAEKLLYDEALHGELMDICRWYKSFRRAYTTHEEKENELILLAFDDDIGVGD